MSFYELTTDLLYKLNRFAEGDHSTDIGSTRFKTIGEHVIGRLLKRDRLNHVSSPLVGWQLAEDLFFAEKHSNSGWAVNFVSGERKKITTQILYVNLQMPSRLSTIDENQSPLAMSRLNQLLDRADRAKGVGDMHNREDPGLGCEQVIQAVEIEFPFRRERNYT